MYLFDKKRFKGDRNLDVNNVFNIMINLNSGNNAQTAIYKELKTNKSVECQLKDESVESENFILENF